MRDDAGAGSMMVVVIAGLLLFAATGAATALRLFVTHAQVSSAADLAALAAARAATCEEGRRVAQANGVQLHSCAQEGTDFQVVVGVDIRLAGQLIPVNVSARAGY